MNALLRQLSLHVALLLALTPLARGQAPSAKAATKPVAERLSAARAAIGWDKFASSGSAVRVRARGRFMGTDAIQTIVFDSSGRFVQRYAGHLTQAEGFDGDSNWIVGWNGVPSIQRLGDESRADIARLFISGGWCRKDAPFEFRQGAGDTLRYRHRDGVLEGEVRLDPLTHLPETMRFGSEPNVAQWTYHGWQKYGDLMFPGRLRVEQSGEVLGFEVDSLELIATPADSYFALPTLSADKVRFDKLAPAALEVRRASRGHLLVRTLINGQDLGWFIFDSGAGTNCIANHVAEEHLEGPIGRTAASGVGGAVIASLWRADSIRVGPLTLESPLLLGLDLEFLTDAFGVEIAGIIGYEFLARCTAEFDARESLIRIYDPEQYALPQGGQWQPAVIFGRHPCVNASFDDHSGLFKIDTGAANDTVTMHYYAVRDLLLLDNRETRPTVAGGVGGRVGLLRGSFARFELSGHIFEDVSASFATEAVGAFAEPHVLGNIGGKLLDPFVLVFDYTRQRLGFVPH